MRNWIDLLESRGTEVVNGTTYFRNPSPRQFIQLLRKSDLRGIVSSPDVYVWDASGEIHHRACADLLLPLPDEEQEEDEEEVSPSLPFYAHQNTSSGDWEWEDRENVGTNCYIFVHREDREEILSCPRFRAIAQSSLRPSAE